MFIDAQSLEVTDGAQIQTLVREGSGEIPAGQGNAGDININVRDGVTFAGSGVNDQGTTFFSRATSELGSGATGSAGNINITANSLALSNGASFNNSTFGVGNAGAIRITIDGAVTLSNADIFSDVESGAVGNAGNISIQAGYLSQLQGAQIQALVRGTDEDQGLAGGQGNAGSISISVNEDLLISGINDNGNPSLITSQVQNGATGNAGNITIKANSISLENEGEIESNIFGEGNGGNIFLTVDDDLNLDKGQISATNQPPQSMDNREDRFGGNIQLQVKNNLILRNNSTISAEATNNANGGNVTIDAGFVVGFPSRGLGSDIRTNAVAGRGGNINIITQGLLGFEFEESKGTAGLLNDTNDIDASSEFGLDGVITISTPDTNPLQRTDRLPTNPVSAETITTEACSPRGGSSSLTNKGKGGIPPQPTAPLSADALIPDGKPITLDNETDLNSLVEEESETEQENPNYIPEYIKPIQTNRGDIYPARGIIKTEDGRIILTTYPTDNINIRTPHNSVNCNSP